MRSFPILWQLTCRHNHISVHAHTEFRFLLLSFNPEQRAPGVINQLASETQLERERGRSGFIYTERCWIRVLVWLTYPSVRHRLSVCALDYFYKAFSYCVLLYMRQTNRSRESLSSRVFGGVSVCDRLTSGKLLMLTIMSWGDFIEIWPIWFRGNFPSWVVTTMWSRAPKQIQINRTVYLLCLFYFWYMQSSQSEFVHLCTCSPVLSTNITRQHF